MASCTQRLSNGCLSQRTPAAPSLPMKSPSTALVSLPQAAGPVSSNHATRILSSGLAASGRDGRCVDGPHDGWLMSDQASSMSAMVRASGPMQAIRMMRPLLPGSGGTWPSPCWSAFSVGLRPNTPQQCAGWRIDPPMSLPISSVVSPAAAAAPPPPVLPPGVRERSHGLFAAG